MGLGVDIEEKLVKKYNSYSRSSSFVQGAAQHSAKSLDFSSDSAIN